MVPNTNGQTDSVNANQPLTELKDLAVNRVESLKFSGVYIQGSVNGLPVTFTVDTGAHRTVISCKTFYSIPSYSKRSENTE